MNPTSRKAYVTVPIHLMTMRRIVMLRESTKMGCGTANGHGFIKMGKKNRGEIMTT